MKRYVCLKCKTYEVLDVNGRIHATPKCPRCFKSMVKRAEIDTVD